MKTRRFKKIKRKVVPKFYKLLRKEEIPEEIIDVIQEVNKNDIMVSFLKTLLLTNNKNQKNYRAYMALIKLYNAKLYLEINEYTNTKNIFHYLDKGLEFYSKTVSFKLQNDNFETQVIEGFNFSEQEMRYFTCSDYYEKIASIFCAPFWDDEKYEVYYKFAYYLAMYINLDLCFNKYSVPENYEVYLAKLNVQLEMVKNLKIILPHDFNRLLIQLNKWFEKTEKQHAKAIKKKARK